MIRRMFAGVTDALIMDTQIGRGQCVLDIATGPGEPALTMATTVGPEGQVFGIDPIAEMVAAARRAAERLRLHNVQFEVAFADRLPFENDHFDAVISRFGVMFFPAPVEAAREILRVLKPGQKLALAAWHYANRNPFHYSLAQVMDRYVAAMPVAPDAPDAFRFAEPGKLQRVLQEAGAASVSERLLRFTIEAPVPVADYLALRLEMSEKLREKIASLSVTQVAEVKQQMLESLAEYVTDDGVAFPAEVLIVSGSKSGAA